jgi:hypothetical protein
MNTLHSGRTDEETFAWCLENVLLPGRGRLGLRQVSPANLPTCHVVVEFIKPELKDWGEHLIADSIFSSLQYRITIERNVSQSEEALQVAPIFIGLFEEKIWKDCGGVN